ncbi:hypothetical protein GCM10009626_20180 [Brachybacterium sacelli]
MRAEFARLEADVITLQETVLTAQVDQAAQILGSGYHLAQQTQRETGRHGAPDGQGITTASRWPIGEVVEVDLDVTDRTSDFACICLITEILAPAPLGRIWVANHFPDYQLDHERERRLQAVTVARALERLRLDRPGHVVVAGDMDAERTSDSMRFWTGRHVIEDTSVCYRCAAEAVHGGTARETYTPANPYQVDPDWPFRSIDHVLVRCTPSGPSLIALSCRRAFDTGPTTVSDHYGLVVDYEPAADTGSIEH